MQEVGSCLSLGQGHMGSMKSWVDIEEGRNAHVLCVVLSVSVVGMFCL